MSGRASRALPTVKNVALHAVGVEDVADLQRERIVGAVVEGDGDLVAVTRAVADGAAEPVHRRRVGRHPRHEQDCPCPGHHPDAYREPGRGRRTARPRFPACSPPPHHRQRRRPPERGSGARPRRAAGRRRRARRRAPASPQRSRQAGARAAWPRPAPTPASDGDGPRDDAPGRHRDEERRRRHEQRAEPRRRVDVAPVGPPAIASVPPMLIATTDVISAAPVLSVPQPADGIATAGDAGPGDEAYRYPGTGCG